MKKILLLLGIIIFIIACSSDNTSEETSNDSFNRTELLTNWADNIIIPRYENYQAKVDVLYTKTTSFTTSPNQSNLDELRAAWLETYKAFQYVGMFSIGKAESINFNSATNIYPTNQTGIQANIASGTYNFALLSQYDKQGLPALDYMLNGLATTDSEIIDFYVNHVDASKYKQYLTDLVNQLKSNIDAVVTDWNGTYKNAFISSNGNSVSSSTNKMVNSFIKYYEKDLRLGKVGYPSGAFVNDGNKYPEIVEAYFKNDVSKLLLEESIKASQDFFNGKHFNTNIEGASLKSYLNFLGTVRDNQNLSTVINNQFVSILNMNSTLDNSYSNQINTDNVKMFELYDALRQNIVYLKLDMMQALHITVDYVDNDGD
ncbi:Iron-regulated protein A [Flavobacterium sp. 9AF]|uniref:imelysin family protein n=1 Tax=Flavobacterium sp. 9AF TaxID=2653142 RepID=UPI0012F3ED6F|nr:imelysin family protein [Flavobacterium sp. 9AF]VXB98070.1 Iron-regulated protein A [Flavobacterium sp. 9AF]